ncbi:hypothetical protein B7486_05905 [cyanobacterium TDX16]|nr:hypothetical protein B7486_05905 [cyanobacterium TDX16]
MKRFLTALALLSMINMAALAVVAGLAWSKDYLQRDRLRNAYAVLTGEADDETTTKPAGDESQRVITSSERIKRNKDADEIARTELERRKREIQNGWDLLERQQLALLKSQESFEETKKRQREEQQRRAEEAGDEGLKKELDILSGLKAKDAKELLKLKADADVVRIMLQMEPRKARKIVGECKKNEERLWIGRILEKLHERDAAQAEVLAAGK